ncbi:hypothetical protein FA13DRAFT_473560 [Coprinellus micaceus]|uniref:Uncharacterized protein n=1 Tax=Coprinellus micaceus TaxID=71717 RepID=A0A4Y7T9Y3_COPMI|nr:hypothetical protein FA13DRAFT_473560 [Coprinellus micaceus]
MSSCLLTCQGRLFATLTCFHFPTALSPFSLLPCLSAQMFPTQWNEARRQEASIFEEIVQDPSPSPEPSRYHSSNHKLQWRDQGLKFLLDGRW